jgi:hypothetical protein
VKRTDRQAVEPRACIHGWHGFSSPESNGSAQVGGRLSKDRIALPVWTPGSARATAEIAAWTRLSGRGMEIVGQIDA